jgi:hypothetical protein
VSLAWVAGMPFLPGTGYICCLPSSETVGGYKLQALFLLHHSIQPGKRILGA